MKEEWLFPGAVVPVDVETTAALVAEIKRLIDVVGGLILKQGPDYERGVGECHEATYEYGMSMNDLPQIIETKLKEKNT